MTSHPSAFEQALETVLYVTARVSSAALILGLVLWLVQPDGSPARMVLDVGILTLMSTPLLRMLVSAAAAVRLKDWMHLATIVTVGVLLALTLVYAARVK